MPRIWCISLLCLGIRRLHTPFNEKFICYKGSAWWTLSRRAIDYIRDFFEERPDVVDYYRRTFAPGESLLLTIVRNNPALAVGTDNLRYIRWSMDSPHPDILAETDLDMILKSGAHFARKLDERIDEELLNRIDADVHG